VSTSAEHKRLGYYVHGKRKKTGKKKVGQTSSKYRGIDGNV
jgi:hypothetical protein